jgi:hypothetical protein
VTRLRMIAAILAFALAVVITPIGIVSYWAQRTITDSERYLETVGPLSENPQIQDAIATFLADKLEEQINPEQLVDDIFGDLVEEYPRLRAIEPIITGAVDALIVEVTNRIVRSQAFEEFWQAANLAAQKSIMLILQGDSDSAVKLEGDVVVLDVSAALEAVKQGLIDRGLTIAERINIPESETQIVLLEAPQLAQLRTIYAIASPVLAALLFIGLALFVISAALSRRRARTIAWTGVALFIIGLGLVIGLGIGRTTFVNTLSGTPFGPASDAFYSQLFLFLINSATVTIVVGIIVAACGWYLSGSRIAAELRAVVDRGATSIARTVPPGPLTQSGPWFARNGRWVRIGIAVVFAIIVVLGNDLSVWRTIIAAILALIALSIVQVLARTDPTEEIVVIEEDVEV